MSETLDATTHCAREAFVSRFEQRPDLVASAPGRVNLIGDHTDYNDGFAMPAAIDRHVVVAASRLPGACAPRVYSGTLRSEASLNIDEPSSHEPGWTRFLAGVLKLVRDRIGELPNFSAAIESDVPVGAGLSSSAAVAVALVNLTELLSGMTLGPIDKAMLCQQAEHKYAGVPCGIMDQIAITTAKNNHAILLDCRSLEHEYVELDPDEVAVLILDTCVSRELASSVYGQRRRTCEEAAAALGVSSLRELKGDAAGLTTEQDKRVAHVVSENRRVERFAAAAQKQDWRSAGALMYESHDSLRDDYEVSCAELDALVEAARAIGEPGGVFGCRMTGGGMGGCAVALVEPNSRECVKAEITARFQKRFGRLPKAYL